MHKKIALLITLTLLTACTSQQATVLTEPIIFEDAASSKSHSLASLSSLYSLSSFSSSVASVSSVPSVASIRIDLPFASQAPTGDWSDPYQEACEEASLIIVHKYLSKAPLNAEIMQQSILDLTSWEQTNGYPQDVTITELSTIAREHFGYDSTIFEGTNVSVERIEQELAHGNPIIVPLAGQDIGNPYFSGEGPPYHMLVIVGYDDKNFLTHDVGTRRGEYYKYEKSIIMNAIHDWTGNKETIRNGEKRMLVVR